MLTKFQGKSSNWQEDYRKIQNPGSVNPYLEEARKHLAAVEQINLDEVQLAQMRALRQRAVDSLKKSFDLDVVTIRSRRFYASSVSLFELLALLEDNGIRYLKAHCSFCRVNSDGTSDRVYIA